MLTEYRRAVRDTLTELANRFDANVPDDELDSLTRRVADTLDEYRNREDDDED